MNSHPPRPSSDPARTPDLRTRHVSRDRRRLMTLGQRLGFGTIPELKVAGREPVLDPPPEVVHRRKGRCVNVPRPDAAESDFALKQEWVALFADLDAIGDGTVLDVEVMHGLPTTWQYRGVIEA